MKAEKALLTVVFNIDRLIDTYFIGLWFSNTYINRSITT
jgi:hypothetical protein